MCWMDDSNEMFGWESEGGCEKGIDGWRSEYGKEAAPDPKT